jgi:UDP-N-acetylmuramyl tripeptide synthase
MVHPAALLGLFAAKKAIAVAVYYGLKRYGFARAYRRALEANLRLTPPGQQPSVRAAVRAAFVAPGKAAAALASTEAHTFLTKVARELKGLGGVSGRVESAVVAALASTRAAGEILAVFQREADGDAQARAAAAAAAAGTKGKPGAAAAGTAGRSAPPRESGRGGGGVGGPPLR